MAKDKHKKRLYYTTIFVAVMILTFSPFVIPKGVDTPWFLGMPRTLWMGILISFILAFLTLGVAFTIQDSNKEE